MLAGDGAVEVEDQVGAAVDDGGFVAETGGGVDHAENPEPTGVARGEAGRETRVSLRSAWDGPRRWRLLAGPGVDLDGEFVAFFAGVAAGVVGAGVFPGEEVDEVERFVALESCDFAAELEVVLGVDWVEEGDGEVGVAAEVAVLLGGGADAEEEVLAVPEEPDAVLNSIVRS